MPSSQPGMTLPSPSLNVNGSPASHDASNSTPVLHATPTYCTVTLSPFFAFGPLPLTMSSLWISSGGSSSGTVTTGFFDVSLLSGVAVAFGVGVAALSPLVVAAAAGEREHEDEQEEKRAMRHSRGRVAAPPHTIRRMTADALPPGPGPIPFNLLGWTLRAVPFMERCRRRYGERFTVDIGPPEGKWIFLTTPEEIREMFTAPADVLHPGEGARVLEPVVGPRSVLLLDGAEHLAQRKLMLPAFHGERMRALVGVMEEVAEAEVAGWRAGAPFALHAAHAGADARDHPARRVRR